MDKNKKAKQTATKEAMPVKETKIAEPKKVEVIVEAPSKVEAKPAKVNQKKKRYIKPVKKSEVKPIDMTKKLNWFQRMFNAILKWL